MLMMSMVMNRLGCLIHSPDAIQEADSIEIDNDTDGNKSL